MVSIFKQFVAFSALTEFRDGAFLLVSPAERNISKKAYAHRCEHLLCVMFERRQHVLSE